MSQRTRVLITAVGIAAIIAILGWIFWPSSDHHRKATCWQPVYAAHPAAAWARDPSRLHRHGRGPRGSHVCG